MSQISPPIRIVLVVAVVFMAAWFTVLKPKEEAVPAAPAAAAPTAPAAPVSKPGQFAAKAKAGAATAEADAAGAANAGIEENGATTAAPSTVAPTQAGTATQAQTAPAPPLPALSADSLKGLPKALRTGLDERRILVLGVLNTEATSYAPMADDDRAVRSVLRDVNRYDGGVVVRTTPIGRLAKYEGLLKALQVTQSPTVVVVDRNRRAIALEGYVDRGTVNQAIADARDTSVATRIKDPYLRKVNDFCGDRGLLISRSARGETVRGGSRRALASHLRTDKRLLARFGRIATPAKWRGLDAQVTRFLRANVSLGNRKLVASRGGGSAAAARVSRRGDARLSALFAPLDRRFNAEGVTACAAKRTR